MLNYAAWVLNKIEDGATLKAILLSEQEPYRLTMQIMMEAYFKTFEVGKLWPYISIIYA